MTEEQIIDIWNEIVEQVVREDLEVVAQATAVQMLSLTLGGSMSMDGDELLLWNVSMVCYGKLTERVGKVVMDKDDEIVSRLLQNFHMPEFGDEQ